MKTLFLLLVLCFLSICTFGQTNNSCCMQVITTKTNNPFSCLTTQKDSIVVYGTKLSQLLPTATISYNLNGQSKNLSFGSGTYALNGNLIKFFNKSVGQGGGLGFVACPLIAIDETCNVVISYCYGDAGPPNIIVTEVPYGLDKAFLISK